MWVDRSLKRGSFPRSWIVILVLAGIACGAKIAIARLTRGTNDVVYWELFLSMLLEYGDVAVYQYVVIFNHPPFMLHALAFIFGLSSATGLPFPFWLRVPAILADLGSLLLVAQLTRPSSLALGINRRYIALALFAVAPISIMISGFHGNTDPVMILFLLLAIYLLEVKRNTWLAGAAFGMALNIKVLPLIFVPAIALYLWAPRTISLRDFGTPLKTVAVVLLAKESRRVLAFFAVAGAVVILGSPPEVLLHPKLVASHVLAYESYFGHWGVPRLLETLLPGSLPTAAYARLGRFLVLGLVVLAAAAMNRRQGQVPLFLQCGLTAFLFLAFSPGFGIQYLAWLTPWVVALGLWPTLTYLVTSGLFGFLVYTSWSRGFPWYFADATRVENWWSGPIVSFELLCWASVLVILGLMLSRAFPMPLFAGTESRTVASGTTT